MILGTLRSVPSVSAVIAKRIHHSIKDGVDGNWNPLRSVCATLSLSVANSLGKSLLILGKTPLLRGLSSQGRCYALLRHFLLERRTSPELVFAAIHGLQPFDASLRLYLVLALKDALEGR